MTIDQTQSGNHSDTFADTRAQAVVSLREINAQTVRQIIDLSVAENQLQFVATNAISLAQALFAPEAWYRAVYVGEEPAGFVMLEDQSQLVPVPEKPEIGLWRFMIDQRFQGRGVGRKAMQLVIAHVRSKGRFHELKTSYWPGEGCPQPFYYGLGFRETGELDGKEVVMALPL